MVYRQKSGELFLINRKAKKWTDQTDVFKWKYKMHFKVKFTFFDNLLFWIINPTIPLAQTTERPTVKTLDQFSFPDDPILQNTIKKRYIQTEQGLSTLFTLWA